MPDTLSRMILASSGHTIQGLLTDIGLVGSLILLAALFVAAEIALISLRESQIRQMALKGRRGARVAALAADCRNTLGKSLGME